MKKRRFPVASDRRFKKEQRGADFGPAERWAHSGRAFELTDQAGLLAARATEECVLDVLLLKNWIKQNQYEAALRFKADFMGAALAAHVVGSYNSARTSFSFYFGIDDRTEAQELAYGRWRKAAHYLGGLCADAVITVVCHDVAPATRAQITALQLGLEKLAGYYGISGLCDDVDQAAARERGRGRNAGLSH